MDPMIRFTEIAVIPLQRAFRSRLRNWCSCSNCAVCDGRCPVDRETFLLHEAARKEPNATVFAWTDDGRIVAVEWKDRWRGVKIECDHDHYNYCGNCDSKELYRAIEKFYA